MDLRANTKDKFLQIYLNKSLVQNQFDPQFNQGTKLENNKNGSIINKLNESRYKRLGSFSVDESHVNTEIAQYVKTYFEKNAKRESKSQVLLNIVQRSMKSIVAGISLWVPTIYKIIASNQDPVQYVYANVVEKFIGDQ
ncbi:UNKNOWN [Stylonychia lemnae]|uniref:Uncharacterized protein n=1 Tax=Stylonychia lemnae TaxID=5949 RepID=A0A078AAQ4_STYLE|nr:UNKNOWN [Stylonychia lemnae]|eukprot:CDW78672.1 UNKNOWN [Stylonychia lemnae]